MRSSAWLTLLLLMPASLALGAEAPEWELAGVRVAEAPETGSIRVLFGSYGFRQPDVPGGGTMTGVSSVVAVGFSPWRTLELEARVSASSVEGENLAPRHVQTVGDLEGVVTWRVNRGRIAAGAYAGARSFAGTGGSRSYGDSVSALGGVLASIRVGSALLLSEVAAIDDRSEEIVDPAEPLDQARRLAWGVSDGPRGHAAFGTAFPASRRIAATVGWRSEAWSEGSAHSVSAGALGRIPWQGRSVFLEGRVHVLAAGRVTDTRPLVPNVAGTIVLTLAAPPAPVRIVTVREPLVAPTPAPTPPTPAPPPPALGRVTGTVRDSESGEPLHRAIVEIPGVLENGVVTDATGSFRVPSVRGGTVTVHAEMSGYESASVTADVVEGKDLHVEIALAPAGGRTTGAFEGFVRSRAGLPVTNATVTFVFRGESRKVGVDDKGRFRVSLPPGGFSVTVEATGFSSQSRSFEVSVGRLSSFEFLLEPDSP